MDSQRLEEFRRKLREGRPVRVEGGKIFLDGEPAGKPAPPPAQAAEAGPQRPEGVLVKQHEWGAESPFYARIAGEARALGEQALLAAHYPGFTMEVDDDGMPYVHGSIGPHDRLNSAYHILIELPPGYGEGIMPRAYLLEPPLRPGAPHMFRDGSLCLDHSGAFTRKSTLLTFLAWITVWLVLYEGWVETGVAW